MLIFILLSAQKEENALNITSVCKGVILMEPIANETIYCLRLQLRLLGFLRCVYLLVYQEYAWNKVLTARVK